MDPYLDRLSGLLGERDPIPVLTATPVRLESFATALSADAWDRPWRPGGWTARRIAAHLCDQEIGFGFRVRQTVAAAGDRDASEHVAQPYDQDAWARPYDRLDATVAVQAFVGLRAWNLAWLSRLELNDWLATYRHPERGTVESVDEAVRFLAGHDLNHLTQLDLIARG